MCFPKDIKQRVVWAYLHNYTFFYATVIHSERLRDIKNGLPKKCLDAALLPLAPPPHYTQNHSHVLKVMYEFLCLLGIQ